MPAQLPSPGATVRAAGQSTRGPGERGLEAAARDRTRCATAGAAPARPSGLNLGCGLDQLPGSPELAEHAKGPRLRCFRRSADDRGHLSEREVEVVTKDEQQPLVLWQPRQGPPQINLLGKRVAPGRAVAAEMGEPEDGPQAAAAQGPALVGHDG